jgi:hypothetical protein
MDVLLVLLLGTVPQDDVIESYNDVQHVNHTYDEDGEHVFTQIMYQDWRGGEYLVEDWRMDKHPSQHPVYSNQRRRWEAVWFDGVLLRKTVSTAYRESWTQHDPEVENRKIHPVECRSKLPRVMYAKEGGEAQGVGAMD